LQRLHIFIDGASKGNPGPAGIGVVVTREDGEVLKEIGESIGRTTNNVAEYTALIRGLSEAKALGADAVVVQTDSELMASQMSGAYKIKAPHLLELNLKAKQLSAQFVGGVKITHVLRHHNAKADALANKGAQSAGIGTNSP
jgi:ribonuclease HI